MAAVEIGSSLDALLRLVGIFYAGGAIFGFRRAAMDFLLTQAISAIGNPDPRETKAERDRNACLLGNLLLVGVGGVCLAALLDVAAWVFVASLALYALYLWVLSPRLFDPFDPPEEPGRSQTWNAFWIYMAATALVLAAWWSGRLTPVSSAHPIVVAVAAALSLALVGYGIGLRWKMRLKHDRPVAYGDDADDVEHEQAEAKRIAEIKNTPLVMRPSRNHGAFFDARNGEPVDLPLWDEYTIQDDIEVSKWLTLFVDLADRNDPYHCALLNPDDIKTIEAAGRPIFERIAARMGPDGIRFDPQAAPVLTRHQAGHIKLMADYPVDPIWIIDGDRCDPVSPNDFGLSAQLAQDIGDWELDLDQSVDHDDPGGPPRWTDPDHDAHEERGRKLAVRIARELAATGRGHVRVDTFMRNQGAVPVRAEDTID